MQRDQVDVWLELLRDSLQAVKVLVMAQGECRRCAYGLFILAVMRLCVAGERRSSRWHVLCWVK